jgi:hypothetical protein
MQEKLVRPTSKGFNEKFHENKFYYLYYIPSILLMRRWFHEILGEFRHYETLLTQLPIFPFR